MGADYSFEMKTIFKHNNSSVATVFCVIGSSEYMLHDFFFCFVEGISSNVDTRCAKWQVCSFSVDYADSFAKKKDKEHISYSTL